METFATKQALSGHRTRAHGVRNDVRFFVADVVCPVCRDDHRTCLRCMRHLQRAQRCRSVLASGALPGLDPSVVAELDLRDRAERLAAAHAGVRVLSGLPSVPHG